MIFGAEGIDVGGGNEEGRCGAMVYGIKISLQIV
jgi:hypothetical protein